MTTNFDIKDTGLMGVKLITPFYMEDNRGYFVKSIEKEIYSLFGLDIDIYEEFETYSIKNVIRGMHFQTKKPQIKIVRVISGVIYDVIIDLRRESNTFGQWIGEKLSDENRYSFWIPAGFAHGFRVLSETAIVSYKCIGKYEKDFDSGIVWNDKILNIDWGTDKAIVSLKDSNLMSFEEFVEKFNSL